MVTQRQHTPALPVRAEQRGGGPQDGTQGRPHGPAPQTQIERREVDLTAPEAHRLLEVRTVPSRLERGCSRQGGPAVVPVDPHHLSSVRTDDRDLLVARLLADEREVLGGELLPCRRDIPAQELPHLVLLEQEAQVGQEAGHLLHRRLLGEFEDPALAVERVQTRPVGLQVIVQEE